MNVRTFPPLVAHPDRVRWNATYGSIEQDGAPLAPAPWLSEVLNIVVPEGNVLELASGRSGTALAVAALGRHVTAVDVSDTALSQLESEASRRNLSDRLRLVHADLEGWDPGEDRFALVLCRLFWSFQTFHRACAAVCPGGVLAWEALICNDVSGAQSRWRVKPGERQAHLPDDFAVLRQWQSTECEKPSEILIARRALRLQE